MVYFTLLGAVGCFITLWGFSITSRTGTSFYSWNIGKIFWSFPLIKNSHLHIYLKKNKKIDRVSRFKNFCFLPSPIGKAKRYHCRSSISSAAPCLSDSSTCREPSCRQRPWSRRPIYSHLIWLHILYHQLSAMNASCEREVYHKELHWVADAAALSKSDLIIIWILIQDLHRLLEHLTVMLFLKKKTGKSIHAENV